MNQPASILFKHTGCRPGWVAYLSPNGPPYLISTCIINLYKTRIQQRAHKFYRTPKRRVIRTIPQAL